MPIEIRRIEYSEVELRNALSLYQAKTVGGKTVSSGLTPTFGTLF